jgi:hypothetical protein
MKYNNKLKAWVRFDGSGRVIAGGPILQATKPKVGNWKEIIANECCNPTTTTTTTVVEPTTTTTTTVVEPTTTTTTTILMYYYDVDIYSSCGGGVLLTSAVSSSVPAVINKWYTNTVDENLPFKVIGTSSPGGTNYTSFFEQTPRDTCAL